MEENIVTQVILSGKFKKQITRVPWFIQNKVQSWIKIVESYGIREVAKSPALHDEPLRGNRFGQRSVRVNKSYRLIYKIIKSSIRIELLEINKHDY